MMDAQGRVAENTPCLGEQDEIEGVTPRRGEILRTLLQSPLVGAELDLNREITAGRDRPL